MTDVSILIPVYGVENYIEKCVRSLFEQTFENIEYIFVNDCTIDASIEILKQVLCDYPERRGRVKIVNHEANKGISCVRNTLLDQAKGEYIYFVDSDDWIEKDAIRCMYEKAKIERVDILICDFFINSMNLESHVEKCEYIKEQGFNERLEYLKYSISEKGYASLWKMFIKRELVTNYKLQFEENLKICEDYVMCAKLFYYAKTISYLPMAFLHYEKRNDNNLSYLDISKMEEAKKAFNVVEIFFKETNIYHSLVHELNKSKYMLKAKSVLVHELFDCNRYHSYYPDLDHYWRYLSFPIRYKILFQLLEFRMDFIVIFFKMMGNIRRLL